MDLQLEPGDIFLTKSTNIISRLIRYFSRSVGEDHTQVNHVGVVVEGGTQDTAVIVEANRKVERRSMAAYARSTSTKVAVYRAERLTTAERDIIVAASNDYVGRSYGYFKIVAHWLDWFFGGVFFFRRIFRMDKYPICSWVVAFAYDKAGYRFGIAPEGASPDDIWDWVIDPENGYVEIHPLELI